MSGPVVIVSARAWDSGVQRAICIGGGGAVAPERI